MSDDTLDLSGKLPGHEIEIARVVRVTTDPLAVRIRPEGKPFIEHLPPNHPALREEG